MLASLIAGARLVSALVFMPHPLTLSDGRVVDAELAYLTVPERRADPASRVIQIAVLRLRGTAASSAPPVAFLPGSPDGASGSETVAVAALYPAFDALRASGDVIILDYRGSGLSRPAITCPSEAYRPGTFANRDSALAAITGAGRRCAESLRGAGFDIAGYTWAEVAGDIAALREALGVPRISIIGFSSGTHAALAFLRGHDRAVSRLVLTGVEGPDDTRKLPSDVDRQMHRIGELVREDSAMGRLIPDFEVLVRRTIDSLDHAPAMVSVTRGRGGERLSEPVGGLALAYLTSKMISGPEEFAVLPALYYGLAGGDATLLARFIQRFINNPVSGRNQLSYMLDGASDISPERAARIAAESRTALLGDAVNFPFPEIRDAWGNVELGVAFRAPVRSRAHTLFVTGSLDGNTPVGQADRVAAGFPNGMRLVIRNGGHGSAFTTPAAWRMIVDFLGGKQVTSDTVVAAAPRLVPVRAIGRKPAP